MEAFKSVLKFGVGAACIAGFIVLTTPSKEAMDARYSRYCLTATNTPDRPYTEEQCRLTQFYKMDVTEWDLILYHYKRSFGHYPVGDAPTERDQQVQQMLVAHYAAHPDEDSP